MKIVCSCYQHRADNCGKIIFVVLFSLLVFATEGGASRSQPPHAQPSTKKVLANDTDTTALNPGARSDFHAKLEMWAAQQHNLSRPTLVLRPKYGLGNQLLSLVSGIALALVTDRRLVVAWEGPFRFLLDPPFHLPEGLGGRGGAAADFTAHSPGFPAAARALACGDLARLLPARVVEVEADQFFLPLVLLSPQVERPRGEHGGDRRGRGGALRPDATMLSRIPAFIPHGIKARLCVCCPIQQLSC
jgi:hypothetical protein